MDFFNAQDHARRNTGRLVIFFALAVLSLIVMTNLLVMTVFGYLDSGRTGTGGGVATIDWEIFLAVSAAVLLVVAAGSIYKISALAGGGDRIAEMLGGELIVQGSGDADKQKILNVVEEMAIASGTPVPPVYLLPEAGINAFAAGYTPSDAVIGVTRGAISKLSRDELQGVIAHEFSHIMNGDMRLNIKLIGILHGILLLGLIGYYVLRGSAHSRSSKKGGGAGVVLGLGLVVIGFAGTFFGNLIKAAVSRQREYLADASAVQFTRNPDGIGGALRRIGGDSGGSVLVNPGAAEISHALFSQGFTSFMGSLFATHPPLAERIKKILPDWNGSFEPAQPGRPGRRRPAPPPRPGKEALAAGVSMAAAVQSGAAFAPIGRPTPAHLGYAQGLLKRLPEVLKNAVHEPFVARAVIYCLVLDEDEEMRNRQIKYLAEAADTGVYDETVRLAGVVQRLEASSRLPLLDMALPALRRLTKGQYELFMANLNGLIEADGRLSLFEWALQKIVRHHLDPAFTGRSGARPPKTTLRQAAPACSALLSLLVYASKYETISEREVFAAAEHQLPGAGVHLLGRTELSFTILDQAIDELGGLFPLEKAALLRACGACVIADGKITPVEVELLRAVADTLDCPMPPLVV